MKEQEKAKTLLLQLSNRIFDASYNRLNKSQKQIVNNCALIAVESHIYNENDSPFSNMDSWVTNGKFWQEVKKEIEAL